MFLSALLFGARSTPGKQWIGKHRKTWKMTATRRKNTRDREKIVREVRAPPAGSKVASLARPPEEPTPLIIHSFAGGGDSGAALPLPRAGAQARGGEEEGVCSPLHPSAEKQVAEEERGDALSCSRETRELLATISPPISVSCIYTHPCLCVCMELICVL